MESTGTWNTNFKVAKWKNAERTVIERETLKNDYACN